MKIVISTALALALSAPAYAQSKHSTSPASDTATMHQDHATAKPTSTGADRSTTDTQSGASKTRRTGPDNASDKASSASDNAATPATPATPADPSSGTSATPATPATPSAKANDPATILRTEFPSYDKDSSGALSKEEFSTWLLALKNAAPQQTPMTDAQQSEWLGSAYTEADVDKNATISLAELTAYLTRGAKS